MIVPSPPAALREPPGSSARILTLIVVSAAALTLIGAIGSRAVLAQHSDAQLPTILRDVMVPMRDGVRLATDVYLPTRSERPVPLRFPVIFGRTPYGSCLPIPTDGTSS